MRVIYYKKKIMLLFLCLATTVLASHFESVCDKGLTIWTLLDLMQAVSMTPEDKLYFAHKTLLELLDFYVVIAKDETTLSLDNDQFNQVIALIDHLRHTFSTIFKHMQHDYLTCLWVILGIIEQKLYAMQESKVP